MPEGTIKKIVEGKGFGFINPTGSESDLFFHASACDGKFEELTEGQAVSYSEGSGPKGPRAESVQPI